MNSGITIKTDSVFLCSLKHQLECNILCIKQTKPGRVVFDVTVNQRCRKCKNKVFFHIENNVEDFFLAVFFMSFKLCVFYNDPCVKYSEPCLIPICIIWKPA